MNIKNGMMLLFTASTLLLQACGEGRFGNSGTNELYDNVTIPSRTTPISYRVAWPGSGGDEFGFYIISGTSATAMLNKASTDTGNGLGGYGQTWHTGDVMSDDIIPSSHWKWDSATGLWKVTVGVRSTGNVSGQLGIHSGSSSSFSCMNNKYIANAGGDMTQFNADMLACNHKKPKMTIYATN